ncbi:hypothetical protein DSLASN_20000 [Desulfoluna limicola]|uniref:Cytochrome c family protein n=1 Tax=Desulfoluna limicola TaxID=2810562 RepID=A0ABM7PFL5_9BACT|nr:cytochrome c family protein [Desulfoluna limicola]BCS96368.1 hypothetical protein DSLASN_20000 [Desulfoluna limicola]
MKKTIALILMTLFVVAGIAASAQAATKGNARKGKYMYRQIYKKAHEQDPSISAKPPISPDTKTQAQWKRVFDKKKFEIFGVKEQWAQLSDADLLNIFTYLHSGAADSPTPAKCK